MAKYLVIVESPAKVKTIKKLMLSMIMNQNTLRFVERGIFLQS